MRRRSFVRLAEAAFTTALVTAALGVGCAGRSEGQGPRCGHCGMRVDAASGFAAHAVEGAGARVDFDGPKCLFRWLTGSRGVGAHDAVVTEYYTREERSIDAVSYVLGSDVLGPMGRELIPIAGDERAATFAREHGGRVVTRVAIDAGLLDGLFR